MESLLSNSSSDSSASFKLYSASVQKENFKADLLIIKSTFSISDDSSDDSASVGIDFQDLYKSLSVTAKEMVDKINELLKAKVPNGVQSLNPADVTPEATADRIVTGTTAFFDAYAKQNPNLEGEELLNKFMATIRSGIDKGYNDAFETLKGLGAFDVEGVQSGVEKTKSLIEEKLKAFEAMKRKEMGLDAADDATVSQQASSATQTELLKQAGVGVLNVTA